MADIFLSYAHVDRPRARPLVELLQSEGWTVWWDRGIEPGTPWQPELEEELARFARLSYFGLGIQQVANGYTVRQLNYVYNMHRIYRSGIRP